MKQFLADLCWVLHVCSVLLVRVKGTRIVRFILRYNHLGRNTYDFYKQLYSEYLIDMAVLS